MSDGMLRVAGLFPLWKKHIMLITKSQYLWIWEMIVVSNYALALLPRTQIRYCE